MPRRRLFYTDHHEIPLPSGHKFPMEKYRLVREVLEADDVFDFEPAPAAAVDDIKLVHDPDYVDGFVAGTLAPAVMRRIGFPWSEALVRRTLASVGATVTAAREALALGWGGTLAGGTHHAFREYGSGYCVFNDIAVAALVMRHEGSVARTAVVDLDVHQGDGTAAIFEQDASVLTVSLHGTHNFPFLKQHSRIDIELPDGTQDADYLNALDSVLPRIAAFTPDIVFYQAGVDGLRTDRLGRLALTQEGLRERDLVVIQFCRTNRIPRVITMGGGYAQPIEHTAEAHANTYRLAGELYDGI